MRCVAEAAPLRVVRCAALVALAALVLVSPSEALTFRSNFVFRVGSQDDWSPPTPEACEYADCVSSVLALPQRGLSQYYVELTSTPFFLDSGGTLEAALEGVSFPVASFRTFVDGYVLDTGDALSNDTRYFAFNFPRLYCLLDAPTVTEALSPEGLQCSWPSKSNPFNTATLIAEPFMYSELTVALKFFDADVWQRLKTGLGADGEDGTSSADTDGDGTPGDGASFDLRSDPAKVCQARALYTLPLQELVQRWRETNVPQRASLAHTQGLTRIVPVLVQCSNVPVTLSLSVTLLNANGREGSSEHFFTSVTYFIFMVLYAIIFVAVMVMIAFCGKRRKDARHEAPAALPLRGAHAGGWLVRGARGLRRWWSTNRMVIMYGPLQWMLLASIVLKCAYCVLNASLYTVLSSTNTSSLATLITITSVLMIVVDTIIFSVEVLVGFGWGLSIKKVTGSCNIVALALGVTVIFVLGIMRSTCPTTGHVLAFSRNPLSRAQQTKFCSSVEYTRIAVLFLYQVHNTAQMLTLTVRLGARATGLRRLRRHPYAARPPGAAAVGGGSAAGASSISGSLSSTPPSSSSETDDGAEAELRRYPRGRRDTTSPTAPAVDPLPEVEHFKQMDMYLRYRGMLRFFAVMILWPVLFLIISFLLYDMGDYYLQVAFSEATDFYFIVFVLVFLRKDPLYV